MTTGTKGVLIDRLIKRSPYEDLMNLASDLGVSSLDPSSSCS